MQEPRRYQTVVEQLLEGLNMGRSFEDLLTAIYGNLAGIVPFNRIGVAILDEATGVLRAISCRSDGETRLNVGYAAALTGSTLQHLLDTGQPRIINDLEAYLAAKPQSVSTALIVQEGMRSSLTLPLLAEGKPIGVMFFSCRKNDGYTAGHIATLKPLAGPIAISLEKAQLIGELRQRNEELAEANQAKDGFLDTLREEVQRQTDQLRRSEERYRTLVRLGRIVNASLDLRQVFRSAAEEIHKLVPCDRVSLLLLRDRDELRTGFAVEFDDRPRWLEIPASRVPGTAAQWVLERRQPRVVVKSGAGTRLSGRSAAVRSRLSRLCLLAAGLPPNKRRRARNRLAHQGSRWGLGPGGVGRVVRSFGDRLGQRFGLWGNRAAEGAIGRAERLPAGRNQDHARFRQHRGRQSRHALRAGRHRAGGGHRQHGVDPRRDGHGQGTGRARSTT